MPGRLPQQLPTAGRGSVRRAINSLSENHAAAQFKAMGNPVRIRVLELLSEREWSVGEMLGELGAGASGLSQHLAVLRAVGLVQARREASAVYYSVTTPRVGDLLAVARRLRSDILALQLEELSDLRDEDEQHAADHDLASYGGSVERAAHERRGE